MSDEAANVAVLKDAYRRWHDSRGGSVDHWMSICDENIKFGSLAQGATGVEYLTAYNARDELKKYFNGLLRDWEMIEYRPDEFVAQGDRVVMIGHCSWRARASGSGSTGQMRIVPSPEEVASRSLSGLNATAKTGPA